MVTDSRSRQTVDAATFARKWRTRERLTRLFELGVVVLAVAGGFAISPAIALVSAAPLFGYGIPFIKALRFGLIQAPRVPWQIRVQPATGEFSIFDGTVSVADRIDRIRAAHLFMGDDDEGNLGVVDTLRVEFCDSTTLNVPYSSDGWGALLRALDARAIVTRHEME